MERKLIQLRRLIRCNDINGIIFSYSFRWTVRTFTPNESDQRTIASGSGIIFRNSGRSTCSEFASFEAESTESGSKTERGFVFEGSIWKVLFGASIIILSIKKTFLIWLSLFKELSELAISTYKHIGRIRSARYIGIDLAKFYLSLGQVWTFLSFFYFCIFNINNVLK